VAVAEAYVVLKRLRVLAPHLELTVIGADDSAGYMGTIDPELEGLLPRGVRFIRVPIDRRGRFFNIGRRTIELTMAHSRIVDFRGWQWVRRATAVAADMDWFRGFDWLVTDSSPVIAHMAGLEVVRRNRSIRWLQHYSDPFLDPIYARYHPLSRAIDSHFARRLVEKASAVSVPCVEMGEFMRTQWIQDFGLSRHPEVIIVPHTYDTELLKLAVQRYAKPVQTDHREEKPFRFSYIGHFYGKRSVAPLLRLVDIVFSGGGQIAGRRIEFHLFGSVGRRDVGRVARYPFVIRHQPVGYLASLAAMCESDALLVIDASVTANAVHFPSKLADYLGTGRPIVAITPPGSPTERIVRETGHCAATPWADDRELERTLQFSVAASGRSSSSLCSDRYENSDRNVAALLSLVAGKELPHTSNG
jgi:hypothetical protein